MIALRSGNSTRALLESAARRLVLRDPPTTLRRTDQEYLTVELLRSEGAAAGLRLGMLPEEFYCPGVDHHAARPATWMTPWPWSHYPCKAVHGHGLHALHRSAPTEGPRKTGRGSTTTLWTVAQVPRALREMAEGRNASPRWYTWFV